MPLRAAFFDVGDTLVEHWAAGDVMHQKLRTRICADVGEPDWIDDWLRAQIEPVAELSYVQTIAGRGSSDPRFEPAMARQETLAWYRAWFESRRVDVTGLDLDRLRALMCVPLDEISTPVAGAFDALRWCAKLGMRVVLVTNTLSRGDQEALIDWERFGVGQSIHGIVSSHSAGWRKPHPAIFERALAIADADPKEVFHVGDNLIADVWGAQQLGIRAVWRRTPAARAASDSRPAFPTRECRHPSQGLYLDGDEVRCGKCGGNAAVEVRPHAIVDDLTQLPDVVEGLLRY